MSTGADESTTTTDTEIQLRRIVVAGSGHWILHSYACDLCGSRDFKPLLKKRGRVIPREFNIVSCKRCNLVCVNPRITDEQIDALYDEAYYRGHGFDSAVRYDEIEVSVGIRRQFEQIVATIIEAVGTAARLDGLSSLDVGCGSGFLVAELSRRGARALGQDSSHEALRLARNRGVELLTESVEAIVESGRRFDVITAIEVIEHVPHPVAFTRSLAALMKPGGLLLLGTGNWNVVRHMPKTPYIMPEGHLHYFTPETMSRLFDESGLDKRSKALNGTWTLCRIASRFGVNFGRSTPIRLASQVGKKFAPNIGPFPIAVSNADERVKDSDSA